MRAGFANIIKSRKLIARLEPLAGGAFGNFALQAHDALVCAGVNWIRVGVVEIVPHFSATNESLLESLSVN